MFAPNYVSYATAHGRTPEAQIEFDRAKWPGGAMCGFLCWMSYAQRTMNNQPGRSVQGGRIVNHAQWESDVAAFASLHAGHLCMGPCCVEGET